MPAIPLKPRLTLHYRSINPQGSPCVLLLHGLGASGDSWGFQIPALAEAGFHILAPDARGFGGSTYPGGKASIADLAGDMTALLRSLGQSRAHVAGISMGGVIALQLALDAPEVVDKLVLINTFARLQVDQPGLWVYYALRFILLHTLGLPVQARAVARRIFPHPSQQALRDELIQEILRADPQGYKAAMRALVRFNVVDRLPELSLPVLVITGDRDTTVSRKSQDHLADGIINATHVIIPDAGHGLIAEHPALVNQLLLDFLK